MKRFDVMKIAKYSIAVSLIVILAGIVMFFVQGFLYGIDFSGGTIVTLDMGQAITVSEVPALEKILDSKVAGDNSVSVSEGNQVIIRYQANSDNEEEESKMRIALIEEMKKTYPEVTMVTTERVGATAGSEMRINALISIAIACVLMLLYIWLRFEFAFGVAAIAALVHDVLVMAAVMVFTQTQVNSSFIAAILTIIGFSINDTIVLFDRIRENLKRMKDKPREEIVEISFKETLTRTLNTSLTVMFTITTLYIMGVQSIKEFALPLIAGLVSGVYSTILFASPLWVWMHRWMDKRNKEKHADKKQIKGNKPSKSKV